MLQGIVPSDGSIKANTAFKANQNLIDEAKRSTHNATWQNHSHLKVDKNNGGVTYTLPKNVAKNIKIYMLKWMLSCSHLIKIMKLV